jgi:hypothetical protein
MHAFLLLLLSRILVAFVPLAMCLDVNSKVGKQGRVLYRGESDWLCDE